MAGGAGGGRPGRLHAHAAGEVLGGAYQVPAMCARPSHACAASARRRAPWGKWGYRLRLAPCSRYCCPPPPPALVCPPPCTSTHPQAVLRELDGLKCSVNPVSWVGARRATALVQAVQRTGLYRGQRCAVGGGVAGVVHELAETHAEHGARPGAEVSGWGVARAVDELAETHAEHSTAALRRGSWGLQAA